MNRRDYTKAAPKRKFPGPIAFPIKKEPKPRRNEKCPCLSGDKFKNCCKTTEVLVSTLKTLIAEDEQNADPNNS